MVYLSLAFPYLPQTFRVILPKFINLIIKIYHLGIEVQIADLDLAHPSSHICPNYSYSYFVPKPYRSACRSISESPPYLYLSKCKYLDLKLPFPLDSSSSFKLGLSVTSSGKPSHKLHSSPHPLVAACL